MAPHRRPLGIAATPLLVALVAALAGVHAQVKVDVGIQVAVLGEYKAVVATFQGPSKNTTKYGRTFTQGTISGKSVVVVACGIGMTNAAMTAQMLVDMFDAKYYFFTGIAGGVNPSHRVGDVVVAGSWFNPHHMKLIRNVYPKNKPDEPTRLFFEIGMDFPNKFVMNNKTGKPVSMLAPLATAKKATKFDKAELSGIPGVNFYNMFAITMEVEVLKDPIDVFQDFPPTQFHMPVSKVMWDTAKKVLDSGKLVLKRNTTINGEIKDIGYQPELFVTMNPGASASCFLDNKEYREQLFNTFNVEAFEMEGASFLHVCQSTGKECLVIRSLSDLAGGEADFANVVLTFLAFASANTAAVTEAIIAELPF